MSATTNLQIDLFYEGSEETTSTSMTTLYFLRLSILLTMVSSKKLAATWLYTSFLVFCLMRFYKQRQLSIFAQSAMIFSLRRRSSANTFIWCTKKTSKMQRQQQITSMTKKIDTSRSIEERGSSDKSTECLTPTKKFYSTWTQTESQSMSAAKNMANLTTNLPINFCSL